MMRKLSKILITCYLSMVLVKAATIKMMDVIGFPEKEENPNLKNKENRQPVFSPSICPLNELYYPGDQKDDWICDCMPGHIYHPKTDQCWPAYRKGPCSEGEYLVLHNNSFVPVCEKNPCQRDSYVLFEGNCQRIGSTAPCEKLFPRAAAVEVNATNLVIGCVDLNVDLRFSELENTSVCLPGCKRRVIAKVGV